MKDKFVLIDASAVVHRAFHALPPLATKQGQLVNAVYGFCAILLKVLNEIKPKYLAVAFDSKEETFRHKAYHDYKAKRVKKGEELYSQFPLISQVLKTFHIPIYEAKGYEADDVIATIVKKIKSEAEKQSLTNKIDILIVTGDLDALQLVDKNTAVYVMRKGVSEAVIYDEQKVKERFGFSPLYLNDYKALAGDSSDNIPGIEGVGEKTASQLVQAYGCLENIYQHLDSLPPKVQEKLKEGKKQAELSKSLSVLFSDVPIQFDLSAARVKNYDKNEVIRLFTEFDFKSLIKRLPGSEKVENQPLGLIVAKEKPASPSEKFDKEIEPILRQMEKRGVLIDVPYLKQLSKEVAKEIERLKKEIFRSTGGEFNLDSPIQLLQILFTRLALPVKEIKKTKTGISTAASELMKIQNAHPVVGKILQYRELAKLKNTYLDSLPALVDKESRLHTTYAPDTQTGRLSSRNPNLQNIPIRTDMGKRIRQAFIAPLGFVLVSADYSQIELRIIAHLSGEPKLISAFKAGLDIHEFVSQALGVSRRVAKVINFGVIYGMSAFGLSQTLNISHEEAQNYIDKFFAEYPVLSKYLSNILEKARKGSLKTVFGREREFPGINSPIASIRGQVERMAINYPFQGSGADIIKLAMIKIYPKIKSLNAHLILTVHDELVFEVPETQQEKAYYLIKTMMENVVKLKVPLVVKISVGKNWGEMKEMVL